MINHLRTLLLNKSAAYFAGVEGAEYIPPSFQPVVLDASLLQVYNTLFPMGLDKFTQNYIATSIMNIAQAPDLSEISTSFVDKRLTYTPGGSTLAKMTDAPVTMTLLVSVADLTPHYQLTSVGYPTDIRLAGQHEWTVTRETAQNVRIRYSRAADASIVRVGNGTLRSNNIELLPGYLTAYFDLPSRVLSGDFTLTYATNIAIAYNIGQTAEELLQMLYRGANMQRVFQLVKGKEDTINAAREVLMNSPEMSLRFGAVVLAYLCQCDDLVQRAGR